MNFFQTFSSPMAIVICFLIAIAASYTTVQKFIQYELAVDRHHRFHALKGVAGVLAFLGTFIFLAFILSYFV